MVVPGYGRSLSVWRISSSTSFVALGRRVHDEVGIGPRPARRLASGRLEPVRQRVPESCRSPTAANDYGALRRQAVSTAIGRPPFDPTVSYDERVDRHWQSISQNAVR
jgi:hypothetical protein